MLRGLVDRVCRALDEARTDIADLRAEIEIERDRRARESSAVQGTASNDEIDRL